MKPKEIIRICKTHGEVTYILEGRGCYRCRKCRSAAVSKRRKQVRIKLVKEFGSRCKICGYDKCTQALEFHHLEPENKKFGISGKGITREYNSSLEEAKKCILVCANCHRELENKIISIPDNALGVQPLC